MAGGKGEGFGNAVVVCAVRMNSLTVCFGNEITDYNTQKQSLLGKRDHPTNTKIIFRVNNDTAISQSRTQIAKVELQKTCYKLGHSQALHQLIFLRNSQYCQPHMQTYVTRVLENSQVYANFSLCKAFFMKLGASLTFVKRAQPQRPIIITIIKIIMMMMMTMIIIIMMMTIIIMIIIVIAFKGAAPDFFTISSLCRELSPTPHALVARVQSCANHVQHFELLSRAQHVVCRVVGKDSSGCQV